MMPRTGNAVQKCALGMWLSALLNIVVALCCISHSACVFGRALLIHCPWTVAAHREPADPDQPAYKPNIGHCGLIFTITFYNYVISQIQTLHMLTRISQQAGMSEGQSVHLEFKKMCVLV